MPKVSVIMPSYNHGKFIADSIKSVLNQTYQDFELVITDDGSSDNTVEIIDSFQDKRIKLHVFDHNQGASAAANHCIRNCSGDFIAMLSSDDIFLQHKLEKQVQFLDNNAVGAVLSWPKMINEKGKPLNAARKHYYNSLFHKQNRDRFAWLNYFFFNGNCLCHPSALIRRSCYDQVGMYDQRYASLPDLDFWIRVCQHFDIFILQEELIKMRMLDKGHNASGRNLINRNRAIWEFRRILMNYKRITPEAFVRIFPDFNINDMSKLETLKDYYLAVIALNVKNQPHLLFAMELLYEILDDQKKAKSLYDLENYTYNDLFKTAGIFRLHYFDERYSTFESIINWVIVKIHSLKNFISFINKLLFRKI